MGKKRGGRLLALCLSVMMLFSLGQGTGLSVRAEENENTIPETQEGTLDPSSEANEDAGIVLLSLPSRSPQKLNNVISNIKITNSSGMPVTPVEGVYNFYVNNSYRYEVDFDLSAYNNNLVNGDSFTFTIPAPIPVDGSNPYGTITFTDPTTKIEIAEGKVISNGEANGGKATITLKNLEEYLKATKGETIQDVKGTFFVRFVFTEII